MSEAEVKQTQEPTKTTESSNESQLYYFYTVGCGFCKKVDPIVDELISEGHNILKLDLAQGNNRELNEELKKEYNLKCGTPLFVNSETGHNVCGFREKDILMKWVNGEEIPEPPKPKGPPPPPPTDFKDKKQVATWKASYKTWAEENSHLPNLPKADAMLERLEKQAEFMKQRQDQMAQGNQQMEAKINMIEAKLDKLMQHLGVPSGITQSQMAPPQPQMAPPPPQPNVKVAKKDKKSKEKA